MAFRCIYCIFFILLIFACSSKKNVINKETIPSFVAEDQTDLTSLYNLKVVKSKTDSCLIFIPKNTFNLIDTSEYEFALVNTTDNFDVDLRCHRSLADSKYNCYSFFYISSSNYIFQKRNKYFPDAENQTILSITDPNDILAFSLNDSLFYNINEIPVNHYMQFFSGSDMKDTLSPKTIQYVLLNSKDEFEYQDTNYRQISDSGYVFSKTGLFKIDINNEWQFIYTLNYSMQKSVLSLQDMIDALIYIDYAQEYNFNIEDSLQKLQLDKFWLNLTNRNKEKSREIIAEYYSRIWMSNKLFTSYKIGWKTDRGYTYTILGSPLSIFDNAKKQSWEYDNIFGKGLIRIQFVKKKQLDGVYDYVFDKKSEYNMLFLLAVNEWRDGRAFHLKSKAQ